MPNADRATRWALTHFLVDEHALDGCFVTLDTYTNQTVPHVTMRPAGVA